MFFFYYLTAKCFLSVLAMFQKIVEKLKPFFMRRSFYPTARRREIQININLINQVNVNLNFETGAPVIPELQLSPYRV